MLRERHKKTLLKKAAGSVIGTFEVRHISIRNVLVLVIIC